MKRVYYTFLPTYLRWVWHADSGRLFPPDTWSYPIWDLHLFIKPKPHYLLVTLTEYDLFTEIYITELERFPQNICNGCGMPARDADSSGKLVPSLWDLHMFYLLRPILYRTCRYFTGLCFSNIPRYFRFDFSILLITYLRWLEPTGRSTGTRTNADVNAALANLYERLWHNTGPAERALN